MSIQVSWDNEEHTIVRYDIQGKWTLQDLTQARQQLAELTGETPPRYAVIADVRQSQFVSGNLFGHFGRSSYTPLPGFDLMVFVGAASYIQTLVGMFNRLYGQQKNPMQFAGDLQEARAQIAAYWAANEPSPEMVSKSPTV